MKRLLLLFTIISALMHAQFEITDSSDNWDKVGSAQAHTILYQKKDKSRAKIQYRDFQNQSLNNMDYSYYEFEFSTQPDTLDKVYQILSDHFANKKEETVTLQFPEGKMMIEFARSFGLYYALFRFEKNNTLIDKGDRSLKSTGGMTEKHVKKLFGKT